MKSENNSLCINWNTVGSIGSQYKWQKNMTHLCLIHVLPKAEQSLCGSGSLQGLYSSWEFRRLLEECLSSGQPPFYVRLCLSILRTGRVCTRMRVISVTHVYACQTRSQNSKRSGSTLIPFCILKTSCIYNKIAQHYIDIHTNECTQNR